MCLCMCKFEEVLHCSTRWTLFQICSVVKVSLINIRDFYDRHALLDCVDQLSHI